MYVRQRCRTTTSLSEVAPEAQASHVCRLSVATRLRRRQRSRIGTWIADVDEMGVMSVFVAVVQTSGSLEMGGVRGDREHH